MSNAAPNLFYDGTGSFQSGINSGVSPHLLQLTQCAFAVNATFRGDFVTNRPPFDLTKLIFASADVQLAFETGLWQGACYYQPDAGNQQIVVQISGRLFLITPDSSVNATITEITIPGDPNSSSLPQAWLWQAENYVIVQNGLQNPIFYDGTTTRRSIPDSVVVGTTSADFTVPNQGTTVDITLTSNFTGLINSVILINAFDANGNLISNGSYIVTKVGGSGQVNNVVLKNLDALVGTATPEATSLIIQPTNLGTYKTLTGTGPYTITLYAPVPAYVSAGKNIQVSGGSVYQVNVNGVSPDRMTLTCTKISTGTDDGTQNVILVGTGYPPNSTVGVTLNQFNAPAIGSTISVGVAQSYTAAIGQILFLGPNMFQVVGASSNQGTANTVTVENLTDNAGTTTAPVVIKSGAQLVSLQELPPGRMGTYGLGRNWFSGIDGISFGGFDLVGSSSGSPVYNRRDAVLKNTQNSLVANGFLFRVPGAGQQITALQFIALLDTSLGSGPLQVFTSDNVFSCNAPVDSTQWQTMTSPILTEALIGSGATGQDAVVRVNGDLIFRCANPNGIRSLLMARLDFNKWGNTPNSREMTRVVQADNTAGLTFASTVNFDNRLLMTCSPVQGAQGVYHQGMIALNFDPLSSLASKQDAVYDGLWTGLNVLKMLDGTFNGQTRAFAFCSDLASKKIQMYELLATGPQGEIATPNLDNGVTPIQWSFESPVLFKNSKNKGFFDLVKLEDGEIYISDLQPGAKVQFIVEYRPDFASCWFPWISFIVCADASSTVVQYRTRLGLGKPKSTNTNSSTGYQSIVGRWFQLRVTIIGHCVFNGCKITASLQPEPSTAPVINQS